MDLVSREGAIMGSRKIDDIRPPAVDNKVGRIQEGPHAPADLMIDLHYPKPTGVSTIIEDVAVWSEYNFVMEPGLNKSLQIFAPRKLKKTDAFNLFVASLETVGLRAVVVDAKVVKIVPYGLGKVAI
jgi:hypothetical protein